MCYQNTDERLQVVLFSLYSL